MSSATFYEPTSHAPHKGSLLEHVLSFSFTLKSVFHSHVTRNEIFFRVNEKLKTCSSSEPLCHAPHKGSLLEHVLSFSFILKSVFHSHVTRNEKFFRVNEKLITSSSYEPLCQARLFISLYVMRHIKTHYSNKF